MQTTGTPNSLDVRHGHRHRHTNVQSIHDTHTRTPSQTNTHASVDIRACNIVSSAKNVFSIQTNSQLQTNVGNRIRRISGNWTYGKFILAEAARLKKGTHQALVDCKKGIKCKERVAEKQKNGFWHEGEEEICQLQEHVHNPFIRIFGGECGEAVLKTEARLPLLERKRLILQKLRWNAQVAEVPQNRVLLNFLTQELICVELSH